MITIIKQCIGHISVLFLLKREPFCCFNLFSCIVPCIILIYFIKYNRKFSCWVRSNHFMQWWFCVYVLCGCMFVVNACECADLCTHVWTSRSPSMMSGIFPLLDRKIIEWNRSSPFWLCLRALPACSPPYYRHEGPFQEFNVNAGDSNWGFNAYKWCTLT